MALGLPGLPGPAQAPALLWLPAPTGQLLWSARITSLCADTVRYVLASSVCKHYVANALLSNVRTEAACSHVVLVH